MKKRSLVSTDLGLALTLVALLLWSAACKRYVAQQPSVTTTDKVVIDGVLEKLGPDLGITNGRFAAFRLAKYRVERICQGEYHEREIVVDHSIFTGHEFDGIKVNDRVCITVRRSKNINVRTNADGIRSPADAVTTFYISETDITRPNAGCCDQ